MDGEPMGADEEPELDAMEKLAAGAAKVFICAVCDEICYKYNGAMSKPDCSV